MALRIALLAAALWVSAVNDADPDLWGHVRFGEDFLHEGIPGPGDRYSWTAAGARAVHHEWFSEVAMAAAFGAGSWRGVLLLKTAAAALLLVPILLRTLRIWGAGADGVAAAVLVLSCVHPGLAARPQVFGMLCLAGLLLLLERADAGPARWHPLAATAALFLPWANLHGSVALGGALLALWAALPGPTPARARGATLAGAAAATLVNPYGWTLHEYLVRAVAMRRPEIDEWAALPIEAAFLPAWILLAACATLLARRVTRPGRFPCAAVILLSGMTLLSRRHLPLLAVAAPVLLTWRCPGRPVRPGPVEGRGRAWLAVPLLALAAAYLVSAAIRLREGIILPEGRFPSTAIRSLLATGTHGDLVTHLDWGEYVLFHAGPGVRVSIDGRYETLYPQEVIEAHRALERGRPVPPLDGAPMALLRRGSPAAAALARAGWRATHEDDVAVLLLRIGENGRTE